MEYNQHAIVEKCPRKPTYFVNNQLSPASSHNKKVSQKVHLVQQFFVHSNPERHKEIQECLRRNVRNKQITTITLLNEREYTAEEMGITEDEAKNRVTQIILTVRLMYCHFFKYCYTQKLDGYLVLCNSDIFFDSSIKRLLKTPLSKTPSAQALLRYEYDPSIPDDKLSTCKLFGPRPDSQDTWIIHSQFLGQIIAKIDMFDFHLGMPGCDNAVTHRLDVCGFKLYNDASQIKTYHYHTTNIRNYTIKDLVPTPYAWVQPC